MKNNTVSLSGFLSSKKLLTRDKKIISRDNSQASLEKSSVNFQALLKVKSTNEEEKFYSYKKPSESKAQGKDNFSNNREQENNIQNQEDILDTKYNTGNTNNLKLDRTFSKVQETPLRSFREKNNLIFKQDHFKREAEEDFVPQSAKTYDKKSQNFNFSNQIGMHTFFNSGFDNFHSSRLETKQCLEGLSRKVTIQINNLNNIIDEFNKKLKKTVEMEYNKLKEVIQEVVEQIFQASEQNVKRLYKAQQRNVNQQIYEVSQQLQSMYLRLQKMKQGIEGLNWKKIAGEVLASDIQKQVETMITKSQKLNIFKNVKLQAERKKFEAFGEALQSLLDLNLSSTIEPYRSMVAT